MLKKLKTWFAVAATALSIVLVAAQPAHATSNMLVGLTLDPADYTNELPKWTDQQPVTGRAEIMRVFFTAAQGCPGGGNPWGDSRIQALKAKAVIPFISWKTYDTACLTSMLNSMPSDIPVAYFTYFHEPEQDMDGATFKSRSVAMWNVFKANPRYATEHRVAYMTIQTKQWTFIHNGGITPPTGVDVVATSVWTCTLTHGMLLTRTPRHSSLPRPTSPSLMGSTCSSLRLELLARALMLPDLVVLRSSIPLATWLTPIASSVVCCGGMTSEPVVWTSVSTPLMSARPSRYPA